MALRLPSPEVINSPELLQIRSTMDPTNLAGCLSTIVRSIEDVASFVNVVRRDLATTGTRIAAHEAAMSRCDKRADEIVERLTAHARTADAHAAASRSLRDEVTASSARRTRDAQEAAQRLVELVTAVTRTEDLHTRTREASAPLPGRLAAVTTTVQTLNADVRALAGDLRALNDAGVAQADGVREKLAVLATAAAAYDDAVRRSRAELEEQQGIHRAELARAVDAVDKRLGERAAAIADLSSLIGALDRVRDRLTQAEGDCRTAVAEAQAARAGTADAAATVAASHADTHRELLATAHAFCADADARATRALAGAAAADPSASTFASQVRSAGRILHAATDEPAPVASALPPPPTASTAAAAQLLATQALTASWATPGPASRRLSPARYP